jgi:hypothetical protein
MPTSHIAHPTSHVQHPLPSIQRFSIEEWGLSVKRNAKGPAILNLPSIAVQIAFVVTPSGGFEGLTAPLTADCISAKAKMRIAAKGRLWSARDLSPAPSDRAVALKMTQSSHPHSRIGDPVGATLNPLTSALHPSILNPNITGMTPYRLAP